MADYPGWIWIMCPECKEFRMIRRSSYVQMQRTIKISGPVHCRKCGYKRYSEGMGRYRDLAEAARRVKALTFNGCTMVSAEGRPDECITCKKYKECLDLVSETNWPGWKKEENK